MKKEIETDLNKLAVKYTRLETGTKQMSIAKVKKILKIFLVDLSMMDLASLAKLLSKVSKRYGGVK